MQTNSSPWPWRGMWALGILIGLGLIALYTWLPADGTTGDLASFRPQGFRIQWLLEKRDGGLQAEDVIVRAGGNTVDEWLDGAPRGPEWRTGGIVSYEILRDGQPTTLQIQLTPVSFRAILAHWAPQFLVALASFAIGTFVLLKRPQELAARLLMLFCVSITLQYLGDAYNVQYATLPWRWPFWLHLLYEHGAYSLALATICYFVMVFPILHPLVDRFPRLVPFVLYTSYPLIVLAATVLSSGWTAAIMNGYRVSWIVSIVQIGLAVVIAIRSIRTARDPVPRAQMLWILWCAAVGLGVLLPGYILPLLLFGRPLLPHPVTMIINAVVPFALAIAILRYRLFDIEVIINRTLVYGTLTILLGGLYLLLVSLLSLITPLLLDRGSDTLVVFIATLSIALAFAPLRRQVQILIDRTFYRTKLDYQRLLPEMSERLANSIVLDELAAQLTEELPQKLQIAWGALAVLNSRNNYFELAGSNSKHQVLAVDHPLVKYLHRTRRPLIRLLPPSHLPAEAQTFLDENTIELSIPLIVGAKLVGLYNLGPKSSEKGYSHDEVRLLHLLGQQAAVAVENGRLFQATERQAKELAGLHEAAVAVSSSLEIEEVLSTLAEQLSRVLDVSSIYICDLDEKTLQSTVLAEWISSEVRDRESDLATIYDMRQYPTALQALTEKRALIIQATDPDLDPTDRASAEQYGWHSILIVPLVLRDRVTGYAELWETRWRRQFTQADIRLCQTAAADAAVAIEHARLFQAEREQRRLAEALQEAADVVSGTLDLDQVLDRILEQVERVVAGDAINIMLVESGIAWVVRWRGYERLSIKEPITSLYLPITKYPTLAQMIETGKPVIVPNTTTDPNWIPLEGWKWLRSYVSAPIQVGGQTVGFLNVGRTRSGQFGPADAQRLEAFAHHAATALENARLYTKVESQLREQTALRKAGTVISSTLDSQIVLSRIAEQMGQVIDATSTYINTFDFQTKVATVIAEYISPQACTAEQISDLNETYDEADEIEWIETMQAGQHDVSHIDSPNLSESERLHMLQYGAKSILYIPLRIREQFIGYAELWDSRQRREFTLEEIALCQDIAQQAAIALENARLYEQAQQELVERKRAEQQIKASLQEKELLLKEIHHRVKNNLQVISSLLYLQSKQIEDPITLGMFHESRHRVRSMALVHEKLYQTKDLASVDFAEYVRQLASDLLRSYSVMANQVALDIDVAQVSLGIDTAIPCGLIVNELVSNSLKHAFLDGQKGKIWIELQTAQNGQYTLVVGDNGMGMSDELDLQTASSLGLQLVSTLVDQLEGDIKIDLENGTRFEITFADPQHEGER